METFQRCFAEGGPSSMKEFWELPFLRDHVQKVELGPAEFHRTCPIAFHEDAVPALRATIWSWFSAVAPFGNPWDTRHAIAVLPTTRISDATRQEIVQIMAWGLQTLKQGIWPSTNHKGEFWKTHTQNVRRAGLAIQLGGRFCFWKGDMEASHQAARYFRCNDFCEWCMASRKNRSLTLLPLRLQRSGDLRLGQMLLRTRAHGELHNCSVVEKAQHDNART